MRIVCDQEYMRSLRPIAFHLDNIAFVINKDFLIQSNNTDAPRLEFRIAFRKDQTHWSFGNRLLIKYNIALNEEDNSATFFSNTDTNDELIIIRSLSSISLSDKSKINSCILISLTIVIICGILLLFFIEYKVIKDY